MDPVPRGKIVQHLDAVITDCGNADSLLLEFCATSFQLDQLRFAVGSPIGGTEEQYRRAFGPEKALERAGRTVLIAERKIGHRAADRRTIVATPH